MALRVALVGGPMYDGLYRLLDGLDVEVVVHADHPTLNRAVAERLQRGERIDVMSTHSKYAPSQAAVAAPARRSAGAGAARRAGAGGGGTLPLRRPAPVGAAQHRRARAVGEPAPAAAIAPVPDTWAALRAARLAFGFPGRESGLFGTFFEIVTVHGGRLFDDALRPALGERSGAPCRRDRWSTLARRAPAELPSWHYDQVDDALGSGRVALAAAWPGATRSAVRRAGRGRTSSRIPISPARSACARTPAATRGRFRAPAATSTARCAWSNACARPRPTRSRRRAARSARTSRHSRPCGPRDERDARRLAITRATIADGMITYPPLVRFPAVEDAGWTAIHRALRGELEPAAALDSMQSAAAAALGGAMSILALNDLVAVVSGAGSGIGLATARRAAARGRARRRARSAPAAGARRPVAAGLRRHRPGRGRRGGGGGRCALRRASTADQQRRHRRPGHGRGQRRRRMAARLRRQRLRHRAPDARLPAAPAPLAARGDRQHRIDRLVDRPAPARLLRRQQGRRLRADAGDGRRSRRPTAFASTASARARSTRRGSAACSLRRPTRPRRAPTLVARQPIGRLGTAEEVAAAICYLASPAAGYTTGTALQIDGGTHSVVVPRA